MRITSGHRVLIIALAAAAVAAHGPISPASAQTARPSPASPATSPTASPSAANAPSPQPAASPVQQAQAVPPQALTPVQTIVVPAQAQLRQLVPAQQVVGDCIGDNRFIYGAGTQLVNTTAFMPAGRTTEFILRAPFDSTATYYVKIEAPYARPKPFGGKDIIAASRLTEKSAYVEKGIATTEDTLIRVQVPVDVSTSWRSALVHVYTCHSSSPSAPLINAVLKVRVSSGPWSTTLVIVATLLAYLGAAYAFRAAGPQFPPGRSRWACLDPVVLTAGSDGKGSLGKLQILFFSVIVFALLLYVLMRTGELSDLSSTVLLLLGIAAVGSTAAKGTDVKNSRFSADNYAWLISKGWVQPSNAPAPNVARWRDLVTSDGEFDVYRYQSCIFSVVVGCALLFVGVYQLASFEIPQALLGLLGLSQAVYITGKLVSPTAIADVDQAVTALRTHEQNLQKVSVRRAATALDATAETAFQDELRLYRISAQSASLMFASATGLTRPVNYEPTLV